MYPEGIFVDEKKIKQKYNQTALNIENILDVKSKRTLF